MMKKLLAFFSREFGFYDDEKPYKIFRVYSLFAVLMVPLLTQVVYSESTIRHIVIDLLLEAGFLFVLFSSFLSVYIRSRLHYFFYAVCFMALIYAYANMYSSNYNVEDFVGFMLAFFSVSIGIFDHRFTIVNSLFFLVGSVFINIFYPIASEVDPNSLTVLIAIVGMVCFIIHYTRHVLIHRLRDRKEELTISRDRLLTVLDSVDNIVYNVSIDEKGNRNLTYVSAAIKNVLGYTADEYITEIKSGRIIERIHTDDLPEVMNAGKKLNQLKEPVSMIYRFLSDDKGYIWIEERVYPKLDSKGRHYANIGISSDVTLRVNNEMQLKQSEERYRSMVERNLAGFYRMDMQNVLLDCNDSFARIMGVQIREDIIGKKINDVYADSTDKNSFIQLLKEKNFVLNHESKIQLQNGKQIWLLENVSLIRTQNDKPLFIEGTIFDITEMKEAEQRIRSVQENLQMVIDNIDSVVYSLDIDEDGNKHFHFVGPQIEQIIGLTREEYIDYVKSGKISELFHPEDISSVLKEVENLKKDKQAGVFTYRFWSESNKEFRWLEESMFPQFDASGRLYRNFGVVRDISDKKKYEDVLKESEKNYRILFERNLAGVFKTTRTGRMIDCNDAFVKIFRYSGKSEILETSSRDFYFNDADRQEYIDLLLKQGMISNMELKYKRKDGTPIWALLNVTLLEDNETLVGTLIDISDLKLAEEKLLESKKSYEDLVDGSPYGIILHQEGDVLFANKASFAIVGLNRKMFGEGKFSIYDFLLPEYVAESKERRNQVLKGEDVPFIRIRIRNVMGNILDVETKSQLVIYEGKKVIQTTLKDITVELELEKEKLRAEVAEQSNRLLEEEIHQHKHTQAALIRIQQFLEGIIGSSIDMIMASGVDDKISMINSSALRCFGYDEEELIGMNPSRLYADANEFLRVQTALEKDGVFSGEITNLRKNGETFISYISASLIRDTQGNVIGSMGVSRDITEIIEAEKIVEEQNAKIKAIFENSSNMIMWTMDDQWRVTSFNKKFAEAISNYSGKDLQQGIEFFKLIDGLTATEFVPQLKDSFKLAFDGKANETEGRLIQIGEHDSWFELFLNPILLDSGGIEEISCVAYDISEKKRAQLELKVSEERYAAMVRALPDLIFRMDVNGNYLDVIFKDPAELAVPPEEIIGKKVTDHFPGELGDNFLRTIRDCVSTGNVKHIEYSIPLGGHIHHYEARYSRINEHEVQVVIRDITEKKGTENELLQSLKEKEILLKEVHHRVKNNLQVISSILNLQSSYVRDENTLQILRESQNRIKSMSFIHESLYQTKMFSSVNFSEYIYDLSKNLVHSYQVYGELVELEFRLGDILLNLDQSIPCGLIVNEIVSNALKYAFPGGRKGRIRIALMEEGNRVTLSVEDNGVGLPEGFDLENTETLGVQLVSTLVEQIDGKMTLKSTPGKGTEYLITFEKIEINR
jgi:PAS domain S-box-containing protein